MAAKDVHKSGKQTHTTPQSTPQAPESPPSDRCISAVPTGEEVPTLAPSEEVSADDDIPRLASGEPVQFEEEGKKRDPTVILQFVRAPGEPEPGEEIPQPEVPPAIPPATKRATQLPKVTSKVVTPTFAPTKVPTAPKAQETKTRQAVLNFEELSYAAMQTELPRIVLNLFKQHPGWQNVPESKITASPVYQQMLDKANKGYENWHDAEARARVEIKSYQTTAERARTDVQKILEGRDEEGQKMAAEKQRLEELGERTRQEISQLEVKINEYRTLSAKASVNSSQAAMDYEQKLAEVERDKNAVASDRASLEQQKKDFAQLVTEYESNATQLEAQKSELDTQRGTNDTVASSLGSAQQAYDRRQQKLSADVAALEAARQALEDEKQQLARNKTDAGTVEQKLLDDNRAIEERRGKLDSDIAAYKQNLATYEAAKEALDGERATLQEGFRQVEQQEEALKGAKDALGKQRLDLETIADQRAKELLKKHGEKLYEFMATITDKVYKPVDDGAKKALTALLEGNKQSKDAAQAALKELKAYLGNAHPNK